MAMLVSDFDIGFLKVIELLTMDNPTTTPRDTQIKSLGANGRSEETIDLGAYKYSIESKFARMDWLFENISVVGPYVRGFSEQRLDLRLPQQTRLRTCGEAYGSGRSPIVVLASRLS